MYATVVPLSVLYFRRCAESDFCPGDFSLFEGSILSIRQDIGHSFVSLRSRIVERRLSLPEAAGTREPSGMDNCKNQ